MKRDCAALHRVLAGFAFVMCIGGAVMGSPAGTMFTYQGRLHDDGSPAGGLHDFVFDLFDSAEGGNQVGSTVQVEDVELVDGHFSVGLDFGSVFDGRQLWLQIGVRPGSSQDVFTTLSPRQRIGATPYAQEALNDSDALAALQCAPGQIPKFVNGRWTCANDETEVIQPTPPAVEIGNWKVVVLAGQGSRLQAIVRDAARGRRFDGSLIYLDDLMREARRIDFFDALPVSYEGIEADRYALTYMVETLEFKVGGVRLAIVGVSGGMTKKLFSNQFIFEVNGEPVANVLIVEPGAIAFNGAEAPLHTELPLLPEFPVGPVRAYGFTVDLPLGSVYPDGYWKHIQGGGLNVVALQEEITGYRFGDVILQGDLTQRWERKDLIDWINGWAMGEGKVVLYDVGGIEFMSVAYMKVRPVLYRPPAVDASTQIALEEELTFRAMMIE